MRNHTEPDYKTIRYSDKECDASGLYCYGYRYYQPWLGRWLSADPAGMVDGLNSYRMVRNNPVGLWNEDGLKPINVGVDGFTLKYYSYSTKNHTESKNKDFLPMITREESKILEINLASDEDKDISVKIDKKTADNLRIAQNTNLRAKELLLYGAMNMRTDINKKESKNISLKYDL